MGIAGALHESGLARASALMLEQKRRSSARQLQDLENLLDFVEAQNLEAQRGVPEVVLAEIAEVARTISVPAPASVLSARSGVRLHDALLSWQGALLDSLRPHRLRFGDRFD